MKKLARPIIIAILFLYSASAYARTVNSYAIIDGSGNVLNVMSWDGVTPYTPPNGTTLALAGPGAAPGGTYVGGTFKAPTLNSTSAAQRFYAQRQKHAPTTPAPTLALPLPPQKQEPSGWWVKVRSLLGNGAS